MPAISELTPIQIVSNDFRTDNFDNTFFGSFRIRISRVGTNVSTLFSGVRNVLSTNDEVLIRSQFGGKQISSNGGTHSDLDADYSTVTFNTGNFTNFTQQGTISGYMPIGAEENYVSSILSIDSVNTITLDSSTLKGGVISISSSYEPRPAGATGGYGDGAVVTQTQRWF